MLFHINIFLLFIEMCLRVDNTVLSVFLIIFGVTKPNRNKQLNIYIETAFLEVTVCTGIEKY